MSPTTVDRCAECGAALAADRSCPGCLLGLGLALEDEAEGGAPVVAAPERLGPYRIVETLGQGGMGIVYLAEQERPIRRRVALKLVKPGMDSEQVLARFETERQALALMSHPNVAKVLDAGMSDDGRPYFVMEYVPGVPITEHSDRARLPVRERLELFLQACDALQHAHQKGIIHRDVKPSNVLVCEENGRPTVKVIDFGVAKATLQKLTEKTLHTRLGIVLGTPEYMSPEQAGMTAADVDTRADIYSLGVVLYELLVGALPFAPEELRRVAEPEMLRIIREVEPPRLSMRIQSQGETGRETALRRQTDLPTLTRLVSGELEWITLKALEKDPARRYSSASELGADVRRYLGDEAVLARPQTTWYRVGKFVRRNKGPVAAAAAVLLALAAGLVASSALYFRAALARDRERIAADQARAINDFLREMMTSAQPGQSGDDARLVDVLAAGAARIDTAFTTQPEVRAALHGTLADVYTALARFDDAEPHWKEVLAYRERTLGAGHVDTLEARKGYAYMCFEAHRYERAILGFEKTLADATRSLGRSHPTTIDAMHLLGNTYSLSGRYREAEPLLTEALASNEASVGPDHRQTVENRQSLAYLYYNEQRLDEAAPLYRQVVETNRRIRAPGHWQMIRSVEEYSRVLMAQGRLDEAEAILPALLEVATRELGAAHIQTLYTTVAVAELRMARGEFAEAELLTRRAAEVFRANDLGGAVFPSALGALALVLAEQGKDEAVDVAGEAVEAGRHVFGDAPSPFVARLLRTQAVALYKARTRRNFAASAARFGEALDFYRARYGDDHVRVGETLLAWARMEHARGRHADAVEKYGGARALFERSGWELPYTLGELRSELGGCLLELGRIEDAEPLLLDGYETLRSKRGDGDGITVAARERLAVLYEKSGRPERAAELQRRRPDSARSFTHLRTWIGPR